jgi:hypothetical protein
LSKEGLASGACDPLLGVDESLAFGAVAEVVAGLGLLFPLLAAGVLL